jgi:hypothetical protein
VEAGGEIVVQDSGGYSTGFTITQSVTIDAAGFNASVISTSNTDLCTISAGASDRVVLRGISFHGASVGNSAITLVQVGDLYIEHCSISEFAGDGVIMRNGGNLFVTGTDIRKCDFGILVENGSSTRANLVAHDSRFMGCSNGVELDATGTGAATGWLSNCTASLCFDGFRAASFGSGDSVDLTLIDCRAIDNSNIGIAVTAFSVGTATIRIANCVVTGNGTGIFMSSGGPAAVIGTNPGTNLISGNTTDGVTTGSVTLH